MSLDLFRNAFIIIIAFLVVACQGDDNILDASLRNSAGPCDLELNDFLLEDKNINLIAYNTASMVTFINENEDIIKFTVSAPVESRFEGVFQSNDSLDICYASESTETTLVSEEGIQFSFLSETKAYYPELAEEKHADVIKVFYNNLKSEEIDRRLVFRKVLDMKTYPPPLYATTRTIDSQFFVNTEFENIEETQFNTPIIKLFYNDAIGVVAFIDEQGIMWQFDSKS